MSRELALARASQLFALAAEFKGEPRDLILAAARAVLGDALGVDDAAALNERAYKAGRYDTDSLRFLSDLINRSIPYQLGFEDGLRWDLDGFETRAALLEAKTGWDEATVNATGATRCAIAWGVEFSPESPEWLKACAEYNAGCYQGVIWTPRRGKGPLYG